MTSAIPEPRLAKADVPTAALREQASTGLYFEYTYAMAALENGAGEVMYRNVVLFSACKSLLMKTSSVKVTLPENQPAMIHPSTVAANFRTNDKAGLTLTVEEAFLTIIRAWQFAAQRPAVGHIELDTPAFTDPEYITVAAHALINEPLLFPINTKDTIALHNGDQTTLRRVGREAEKLWLAHATEPAHDDGTPAHRIPTIEAAKEIDGTSLLANMAVELVQDNPDTYPKYVDPFGDPANPTAKLRDQLKSYATGEKSL